MSSEDFFTTKHIEANLKRATVRGGAVTMSAQAAKFILQLGSTAVLARLLTPNDYGLIAMLLAVTSFFMVFQDLGLSLATIQRAEISRELVNTLFWVNAALGALLAGLAAILAPVVAWFYDEPRLLWPALALAGTFLLSGLAVQHQALLRRQMRFGRIAVLEIIAGVGGITVGISCAIHGFSYWSLAFMHITFHLLNTVGYWIACPWLPGLPTRGAGVRSMLRFGRDLSAFNIVNFFSRSMDNILLGKYWGAVSAGTYSKAYAILNLPLKQINGPLASVAIPALSRATRDNSQFRTVYYRIVSALSLVTIPTCMFLAVSAEDVIAVLLGSQWMPAVPIFQILAVLGVIQPVMSTVGWVYVSLGQTDRMAKWGAFFSVLIVLSFFAGLPWGAAGVAVAYTLISYLIAYPSFRAAFKYSPLNFTDLALCCWRPLVVGAVIVASNLVLRIWISPWGSRLRLLACAVLSILVFVLLIRIWRNLREQVSTYLTHLRSPGRGD